MLSNKYKMIEPSCTYKHLIKQSQICNKQQLLINQKLWLEIFNCQIEWIKNNRDEGISEKCKRFELTGKSKKENEIFSTISIAWIKNKLTKNNDTYFTGVPANRRIFIAHSKMVA